MFQKENLEEKVWYRFLKIVYISFFISVFLITALTLYERKPFKDVENRFIICDNGITYKSEDYGINSSYLDLIKKIRIYSLCGGKEKVGNFDIIGFYNQAKQIEKSDQEIGEFLSLKAINFDKKNYNIKETYKIYGSWQEAVQNALITFFMGIMILEIVKKTFLYILIGGNWLKL